MERIYVGCVDNSHYPVSLELGKLYERVGDKEGWPSLIRVVDESGEHYLYPSERFEAVDSHKASSKPYPPHRSD